MAVKHNDQMQTSVEREVYPKPEHRFSNAKIGMTYRDSTPDFPTLDHAPTGAPNVVLVLLDDVGYGLPSTCGGLVRMPAAERLARRGLNYSQFHTTGLCAPTRAALLTGRNHHSVSTGIVQEMATGFPGYCGILPRSCATIAQILSPNGYATGWWGKNHNTPDSHTSSAGPFSHWPTGFGFDYFYGFIGGETDQFYPTLFRNTVPVMRRGRRTRVIISPQTLRTTASLGCVRKKPSRRTVRCSSTSRQERRTARTNPRSHGVGATPVASTWDGIATEKQCCSGSSRWEWSHRTRS